MTDNNAPKVGTRKNNICPYCGIPIDESGKSPDHIIPKQIGGPNKFEITSCEKCNHKLSKIEQKALQSLSIKRSLKGVLEDGFEINKRRSRGLIPLQKEVGFGFNAPLKMYYDVEKEETILTLLSHPLSALNKDLSEYSSFIVPVSAFEDDEEDIVALGSLAHKIVVGTCAWLWGDKFSKSKQAEGLRDTMWNNKINNITELDSNEKHLELDSQPGKDALDNKPDHTILVGKEEDKVLGLVNLFGCCESLILIGDMDRKFDSWLKSEGVVVIVKTTKNEVLEMNWDEYLECKTED